MINIVALSKPTRNTEQVCDLQSTYTDTEDCADEVSLLKCAVFKARKLEENSKSALTRLGINYLSLQACQDGKLKGFDSTGCNTYQADVEATSKPACLNWDDNQHSSMMVISYNNLGLLSTISCWKLMDPMIMFSI